MDRWSLYARAASCKANRAGSVVSPMDGCPGDSPTVSLAASFLVRCCRSLRSAIRTGCRGCSCRYGTALARATDDAGLTEHRIETVPVALARIGTSATAGRPGVSCDHRLSGIARPARPRATSRCRSRVAQSRTRLVGQQCVRRGHPAQAVRARIPIAEFPGTQSGCVGSGMESRRRHSRRMAATFPRTVDGGSWRRSFLCLQSGAPFVEWWSRSSENWWALVPQAR